MLDAVRSVVTEDGVAATLSIGVGKDADDYETLFKNAGLSIEMALSRGGDQVVVRNRLDFEFYGGKTKSTEKAHEGQVPRDGQRPRRADLRCQSGLYHGP